MVGFGQTLLALAFLPAATGLLIKPGDARLYFSEKNWMRNATHAITVNPGAYLKAEWSGSKSASLALQATHPDKGGGITHYMNVVYSLDNRNYVEVPILGNTTAIPLGGAETEPGNHTLVFFIYNSMQGANRWKAPEFGGASLIVTGLLLDDGAILTSPALLPKRAVFFGDSITEGVNAECKNPDPSCRGGDLCANAATKTWGPAVAAAFQAEYSQVGFGSLGWVVSGAGGVPAFCDPGTPTVGSWNQLYDGVNRSFDNIDYVFVLHATNDGLRHGTVEKVTSSVQGWLGEVRQAVGPATKVFLVVPFGGFGSKNAPVGSLKQGFDAYQKSVAPPDKNSFYIDLGKPAAVGLECGAWERGCVGAYGSKTGSSIQGCDGIHPRGGTEGSARHGELAAMLSVQAALAMAA